MYIDICMYMSILMTMNIYISKVNEQLLRQENSMSGLVNHLLSEYYGNKVSKVGTKIVSHSTLTTATHDPSIVFTDDFGA